MVVYRRPVEGRTPASRLRDAFVHDVVVELVAELLGLEPETVDPDYPQHDGWGSFRARCAGRSTGRPRPGAPRRRSGPGSSVDSVTIGPRLSVSDNDRVANTGAEPGSGTTVTANVGAALMSRRSTATWPPSGTLTVGACPSRAAAAPPARSPRPAGRSKQELAPALPSARREREHRLAAACVSGLFAAA